MMRFCMAYRFSAKIEDGVCRRRQANHLCVHTIYSSLRTNIKPRFLSLQFSIDCEFQHVAEKLNLAGRGSMETSIFTLFEQLNLIFA